MRIVRKFKKKRYSKSTKIIIITGSIGMGKSTTLSLFKYLGYPFFDADYFARKVVETNTEGFQKISKTFPSVIKKDSIDRKALGEIVFSDPKDLERLERIIHPQIKKERERFIRIHRVKRSKIIVLDIPLFFEKENDNSYSNIFVITAPSFIQKQRVLRRIGMNKDKFINILNTQIPDIRKRQRGSQVIQSGLGKRFVLKKIRFLKTKLD